MTSKDDNEEIRILCMIRTFDCYQVSGYCLSYYNKLYALVNISHCSCNETEIGTEEEHTLTYEEIRKLAEQKSDPRVPDIVTNDIELKKIYNYILSKDTEEEMLKD